MDADASHNTYDMEQIAAHAEKMANLGAERFHPMTNMNPAPPPPLAMPMPIPTTPSNAAAGSGGTTEAASTITPHDSFEVYNPVDDSFAAWHEEETNVLQQQRQSASGMGGNDYEETSLFTVKKLPFENKVDESYISSNKSNIDPDTTRDTLDALVEETHNMKYSSNNDHTNDMLVSSSNNTPPDDDALARAVAEQDLPPGVSAIEQQEIMMRLLTQQIRRGAGSGGGGGGDGSNNDEPLSPALEQRMRDFQFAQRKRREMFGNERPWGILGLYDHLGEKCLLGPLFALLCRDHTKTSINRISFPHFLHLSFQRG
jgi:hypothetical protein